jgi:hypothetical protein
MASFMTRVNEFFQELAQKLSGRGAEPVKYLDPQATPTPTPPPKEIHLNEQIKQGIENYAPDSPLIDYADQLAEVGEGLPHKTLPGALAIKESSALRDIPGNEKMREFNNPFGIKPPGGLAQYPDIATSIVGGGPNDQQGLKGVLGSGAYDDYLESGELEDFLNVYTPGGGANRSIKDQIEELQEYLDYFKEQLPEETKSKKKKK